MAKENSQNNELKREVSRQTVLLENRLGIFATAGVVFDLTSEQIEESITQCLVNNGIDCENEHVYVRCVWNSEWDKYISNRGDQNVKVPDSPPFDTYVTIRPSKKKNEDKSNENNRVLTGVMKFASTASKSNFYILNNATLNNVLQYQFRNGKECKWKLTNNNSYAVVKLNFDKVISYIFAEDKTSSKVIYDILRKDNYKNKASHEGVFAIKILKTYFNEFKYKNLRKDPIAFLRGSKC